jgi:radical SAM/Cys-rich protein
MIAETVRQAAGDAGADFERTLRERAGGPLQRMRTTTLQVNVGKHCNQACHHCHVEAGPLRPERMSHATALEVLALLDRSPELELCDITGGAPELNPNFRFLVGEVRRRGRRVIDRCNLTILQEPGQEDLADFLRAESVEIVASLPCYLAENVERQRGRGVYDRSVAALAALNARGYGLPGSPLRLDLVYNPGGPSLPPPQVELESAYRRELRARFGLEFHHLLTLTNMPIKRFADSLAREGRTTEYMSLLVNHFNPGTVEHLMCRSLLSVGWDGQLYDCDFNQMLELPLGGRPRTVGELSSTAALDGLRIATGPHCFGCTAGAGSSCGGTLT